MMKNQTRLNALSTLLLGAVFVFSVEHANAQDTKSVAGTYALVSNPVFGDNPRGQLILGQDGHYSSIIARAMLPKAAAGARDKGTATEDKAIVAGSLAHYGRYTVDDEGKTIVFNVEASTFPSWDGTARKQALKINGNQIIYTNSAPSVGGSPIEVVWKRIE